MKSVVWMIISYMLMISVLEAEIERVMVTWTAMQCEQSCIKELDHQFRRIPGLQDVEINQGAGVAILKWKKDVPFTFSPVNVAMELIGLTINDIRVTARGKIEHTGSTVTLVSDGDGTRFQLLNPVMPNQSMQATQFNIFGRGLTQALRDKLLDGEKEGKIATISGPLLFPERSPPLYLVVDQLGFSEPKRNDERQ